MDFREVIGPKPQLDFRQFLLKCARKFTLKILLEFLSVNLGHEEQHRGLGAVFAFKFN